MQIVSSFTFLLLREMHTGHSTSMDGSGLWPDLLILAVTDAGWSSPVARQAHNLKVVGSNPTPAPKPSPRYPSWISGAFFYLVFCLGSFGLTDLVWREAGIEPAAMLDFGSIIGPPNSCSGSIGHAEGLKNTYIILVYGIILRLRYLVLYGPQSFGLAKDANRSLIYIGKSGYNEGCNFFC